MANLDELIDGVILELEELKKENGEIWKDLLSSLNSKSRKPKFKKGSKVYLANDHETEFIIKEVYETRYSYEYKINSTDGIYVIIVEESVLTSIL